MSTAKGRGTLFHLSYNKSRWLSQIVSQIPCGANAANEPGTDCSAWTRCNPGRQNKTSMPTAVSPILISGLAPSLSPCNHISALRDLDVLRASYCQDQFHLNRGRRHFTG